MAGQQLLEVTLSDESKAWFDADTFLDGTLVTMEPEQMRPLWEKATPVLIGSVLSWVQELDVHGNFSQTCWLVDNPHNGQVEVWLLYREGAHEPALASPYNQIVGRSRREAIERLQEDVRHTCLLCHQLDHDQDPLAMGAKVGHACVYERRWRPAGPGDPLWSWRRRSN